MISAPAQFLDESSSGNCLLNPEFTDWKIKDQFIFSWLLSSISESMLGYVHRCVTAADLYYVLKMTNIVDQIRMVGHEISDDELVLDILNGLSSEYESVVVHLTSQIGSVSISEVQFTLHTHESRIQQLQQSLSNNPQAFTASGNSSVPVLHMASKKSFNNFRPPKGGFQCRNRGRGRFFRGGNSRLICQICGKHNHITTKCFKRYDPNFTGLDSSFFSAPPGFMSPQANFVATPYQQHSSYVASHTENSKPASVFVTQQPGSHSLSTG
ncbi:hypothetical protein DH2020_026141 [Rehmannia glutinosa]|uniref:Uncharacterized protein n=1 Tax=Rehmannia glutinosa TaxID=99300 RepID=A0ABR0VXX9_REHGL